MDSLKSEALEFDLGGKELEKRRMRQMRTLSEKTAKSLCGYSSVVVELVGQLHSFDDSHNNNETPDISWSKPPPFRVFSWVFQTFFCGNSKNPDNPPRKLKRLTLF